MNKKIKEKWVKALRSGKYKKTTSCLHNEKGFCCLGVLTDLYIKSHKIAKWKHDNKELDKLLFVTYNKSEKEMELLPERVMKWSGLEEDNPTIEMNTLSSYNDENMYSFKRIATLIEKSDL